MENDHLQQLEEQAQCGRNHVTDLDLSRCELGDIVPETIAIVFRKPFVMVAKDQRSMASQEPQVGVVVCQNSKDLREVGGRLDIDESPCFDLSENQPHHWTALHLFEDQLHQSLVAGVYSAITRAEDKEDHVGVPIVQCLTQHLQVAIGNVVAASVSPL